MNYGLGADENNYVHTEVCGNCGHTNIVRIPKGTRVSEFLREKSCTRCGVKLKSSPLERRSPDVWMGVKPE